MSDYPSDLRYTNEHEWVRKNSDGTMTIGITQYAAKQLGDVVFVELPEVGRQIDEGDGFGTVESVKAVSELFAPMSGAVTAVNEQLDGDPELVNQEPYGEGWFIKLRPSDAKSFGTLMSAADYEKFVTAEGD